MKKVLLSAYACEPNRGSEPGVGWNWAIELSKKGYEVWVLTRANNQDVIDNFLEKENIKNENLHFVYYDLPEWAKKWKKGIRGVHLYYLLWQWGAYKLAKELHKKINFDVVHHVTFVSIRQPSFMGNLGIPFIFGPVAGGDRTPFRLRTGYSIRGWLWDLIRDLSNYLLRFDPLVRSTLKKAKAIYVSSNETLKLVPKKCRYKTKIKLAIGIEEKWLEAIKNKCESNKHKNQEEFKILFVGRFIYLKGMDMGIRAFAQLLKNVPNARLTMVGTGPDEDRWRKIANDLGVSNKIDWIPWVEQEQLHILYREHDLFLFPSLRDSGGMVVLEALSYGLPTICLDLGGPGIIVNEECGKVISTAKKNKIEIIKDLAKAMEQIILNETDRVRTSNGALNRVRSFEWSNLVKELYD